VLDSQNVSNFLPMPELQGNAKELYLEAYGQSTYDLYSDTGDTFHGGRKAAQANSFLHRPSHDVESIFWTLFSTIIRVCPVDGDEQDTHFKFHQAINTLDMHVIDINQIDGRAEFLGWSEESFGSALHPNLAGLASMMQQMSAQIQPEYARLSPSPKIDHLHEAMRRLLLQQIVKMRDNPIPLDPNKYRVQTENGERLEPFPRGKRAYETRDITGSSRTSKKSKGECLH
jgi:hypothetical protein